MAKLVRDRIPEICRANGEEPTVIQADPDDYAALLLDKLDEEAAEVRAANPDTRAGELADVLEVVYAIADNMGMSREDLERIRQDKAIERGGFALGLVWHSNEARSEPFYANTDLV
jgi:predicted house-cleaning noncanonical NTP pyrophosphatase (MazG superfamily)